MATGAGDAAADGGVRVMVADAAETTLLTGHRGGAVCAGVAPDPLVLLQAATGRAAPRPAACC